MEVVDVLTLELTDELELPPTVVVPVEVVPVEVVEVPAEVVVEVVVVARAARRLTLMADAMEAAITRRKSCLNMAVAGILSSCWRRYGWKGC